MMLFAYSGSARLTQILLPLIRRANGRIIFLSSGTTKHILNNFAIFF